MPESSAGRDAGINRDSTSWMTGSAEAAESQKDGSDDLSFGELRRLGIRLAQKLAGKRWTDYNLHDPGVTLLEQLCYALTDLDHRAGFDIADHLTSSDGEIDYEKLGLMMPEDIFSCRPTTPTDYRRLILDAVPKLDDVRINPLGGDADEAKSLKGLFRILLRPKPGTAEERFDRVKKVKDCFNDYRNLCEDVAKIAFVEEIDCDVYAQVEVGGRRAPEEILAEIYHRCAAHIASRIPIHPFEQARRTDRSLKEIFTGPRGLHGFFEEADLKRDQRKFAISEFFSLINQIEGVDYVRDLYFDVEGDKERDSIGFDNSERVLRLSIPTKPDKFKNQVKLFRQGRNLNVPFDAFKKHVNAWKAKEFGTEPSKQDIHKLYTKPRGEYRDLSTYTSVQTQLPPIYGVGARDFPESASSVVPSRRMILAEDDWVDRSVTPAQARQLKGYLVLFDQLLANYMESVEHLRDLYSTDFSDRSTYAWQRLDRRQRLDKEYDLRLMSVKTTDELKGEVRSLVIVALVGDSGKKNLHIRIFDTSGEKVVDKEEEKLESGETLESLKQQLTDLPLQEDKPEIIDVSSLSPEDKQGIIRKATSIAVHTLETTREVVRRYDNAEERKGRLLDYLLALYGEGFSQSSIKAFNSYATIGERERDFVDNKARFLRDIVKLTRDRGAAIDYRRSARNRVSGLQRRVSYLLGFADCCPRSLTGAFRKYHLRPVSGEPAVTSDEESPHLCLRKPFDPPKKDWEAEVPLQEEGRRKSLKQLMEYCGDLLPGRKDGVPESVLSRGISLANYRLGCREGRKDDWHAFLLSDNEAHWWWLKSFQNRNEAVEKVNELRRLIRLLNVKSEGMHLIEHILLRPRSPEVREHNRTDADNDFFSLRLSIVFPDWTARFQDGQFRQLVKETVHLNCPAHIVPWVFWLGFDDMKDLEILLNNWKSALSGENGSGKDVDAASKALRKFLSDRKGEDCWDFSPGGSDE